MFRSPTVGSGIHSESLAGATRGFSMTESRPAGRIDRQHSRCAVATTRRSIIHDRLCHARKSRKSRLALANVFGLRSRHRKLYNASRRLRHTAALARAISGVGPIKAISFNDLLSSIRCRRIDLAWAGYSNHDTIRLLSVALQHLLDARREAWLNCWEQAAGCKATLNRRVTCCY